MKITLLILSLLFTFSNYSFANDLNEGDSTLVFTIGENLKYKFTFIKQKDENVFTDIIEKIEYAPVGDLNSGSGAIVFTDDDYATNFEFDDYNFDGILDIYVHDPCMILGNCFGTIYLFKNGKFEHESQLDDLTTITPNPENKTIFSSNRSAAGSLFTNETFKWEGDKLILIKRVSQNLTERSDTLMYLYKVEEIDSGGNLVVIKQELLQEPNLD